MKKNRDLVRLYEIKKEAMCDHIGQRKVKYMLNSLIKKGDVVASMYKLALEIENSNINAKKYHNTSDLRYKDMYYEEKETKIRQLISICQAYNEGNPNKEVVLGWQCSDVRDTDHIMYFELPDMRQISFHTTIPSSTLSSLSKYEKNWDGLINSTLDKIEEAINNKYSANLQKYKNVA